MRRFLILAALVGCTGANDAAPDERCGPVERADVPEGANATLTDAAGREVRYWYPEGAALSLWPGTRSPMSYDRHPEGYSLESWGCWPGGELAFECVGDACTCYEAGQTWDCPLAPGGWFSAVDDANEANGPYVPVTQ